MPCESKCRWKGNERVCAACRTGTLPQPFPSTPAAVESIKDGNKAAGLLQGAAKKVKARGRKRHKPGEMNKTEKLYAEHLDTLLLSGQVLWWGFEKITLKLADDTRYTPDFDVLFFDGVFEFHETKHTWKDKNTGLKKPHYEDDAKVKIKIAAELLPFTFKSKWLDESGTWVEKEF